ncbi:unnamed protein product, partial [Candidula unifasciata]
AELECVSLLVEFAKDRKDVLNAQNNKGLTALMAAAAFERTDLIRELLCHGADVNIEDNHGDTVLFHYLSSDCEPEQKLLLEFVHAGIDVNRHNKDGLSPLMVAAKNCLPSALVVLLDSGADVNAVSVKDETKTALSLVPINFSLCTESALCIETLLDKGADASYVNPRFLPELILTFRDDYIPKLISCGLCPSDFQLHDPETSGVNVLSTVSPLCLALLVGNVLLAQYFVDNLFLTKSDVSSLSSSGLRDFLHRKKQQDCVNFLDTITEQPWSLFHLALVAVSSAVGTSPGRENQVNALPLPEKMKHKLLYRADNVELMTPRDPDTVLQIRCRGFWMRKFGDYYTKTKSFQYIPEDLDSDFDLDSLLNSDSDDDFEYGSELFNMIYGYSVDDFGFDLESGSNYSYSPDSDW